MKMGSLHASKKWSFSEKKKYFLYSIIKIYDVNHYQKHRKNIFCNLTIFELVNEIRDFESLCLEATEPISELVTQMVVELIKNHFISVQQKR